MTFLSLNVEKSVLTQQKDLLEYQEMCLCGDINDLTEEIGEYQLENDDGDYDNEIAYLEAYQESYDSQKKSIESQLEVINAEIDSYDKAVTNNIKNECKLSISV